MPVLEAMPAVIPDTRSKGSVTADTALRLRLDITPGAATVLPSSLQHRDMLNCADGLSAACMCFIIERELARLLSQRCVTGLTSRQVLP